MPLLFDDFCKSYEAIAHNHKRISGLIGLIKKVKMPPNLNLERLTHGNRPADFAKWIEEYDEDQMLLMAIIQCTADQAYHTYRDFSLSLFEEEQSDLIGDLDTLLYTLSLFD